MPNNVHHARGTKVCVAPDGRSARAGLAILEGGGNAFDAVVAAGFMEAVVEPHNCGIGGYGGVGIGYSVRDATVFALDANTVAPALAFPGLFPIIPGRDPNNYRFPNDRHRIGALAVGVPGVLGGLCALHARHGRLPLKAIMQPAIEMALEGPVLTGGRRKTWLELKKAAGDPIDSKLAELAARSGDAPLPMPLLAETLRAIAELGPKHFYEGTLGRRIADFVQSQNGILRRGDLAAFQPLWPEPVEYQTGPHRLMTAPPATGGLSSLQMIAILERLRSANQLGHAGGAAWFEGFLETLKVVWEHRLTRLADPPAMHRSLRDELSTETLQRMTEETQRGLRSPRKGQIIAPDPLLGTAHLSAADSQGNLIAWTQTHGGGFGSKVMVAGTEIVLGHGMCRFEPRSGWVNSLAAGKRPLHNMGPVLVLRDGKPFAAVGAAGGRTIVNNVAAVAFHLAFDGMEPDKAVEAPRLQCETIEPARLEVKAGKEVADALRKRGHEVTEVQRDPGVANAIQKVPAGWIAAAETRSSSAGAFGAGPPT